MVRSLIDQLAWKKVDMAVELSPADPDNCATDHAAKWETANVMYLYPDRVDMRSVTIAR